MSIIALDKEFVAGTYGRFPLELTSGKGCLFYDAEGKEYIDMGTGIGVTAFGTADEEWVVAVTEQLGKLQHTSNLYFTEPCAKLAQQLCTRTGMKKVFFSNSGAESNECAIKVARKYSAEKKGADCYTILTLENSFHGRTLTTLAATGQEHYHELFQPITPGFIHVPANDAAALEKAVAENKIAGIMMEMVQGEGGVIALEESFVQQAAAICKQLDIPLIIDEVQTGNGRTGKLYAFQHYGIEPDLVSTAKGLGGGLPLGACMMGEKVQDTYQPGMHGSTFGGNPVCCAGAVNILNRIDDKLLAEVQEKSRYIIDTLTGKSGIKGISGMGLMLGIQTEKKAGDIVAECREMGVLVLTAKDKVRLLPPLNIPMDTLKKAVAIIEKACAVE